MSDDINKMDFKQLRNEVQLLLDELAIMQRKYEDILYNLDDDNFSAKTLKEKETMKESIIETGNSVSSVKQTAEKIESEVFDEDGNSKIEQTADQIRSEIEDLENNLRTEITQGPEGLVSRVEDLENFQSSTFIQNTDGFMLDGEKTAFTGVIFLTNNDGENRVSLFHDETDGFEKVILHSTTSTKIPIIIGDSTSNVYIGSFGDGNQAATRQWVLDQL